MKHLKHCETLCVIRCDVKRRDVKHCETSFETHYRHSMQRYLRSMRRRRRSMWRRLCLGQRRRRLRGGHSMRRYRRSMRRRPRSRGVTSNIGLLPRTVRHGVAALDFATVSGCIQLAIGPTHARGGTLDLPMTDVPDPALVPVVAPLGS